MTDKTSINRREFLEFGAKSISVTTLALSAASLLPSCGTQGTTSQNNAPPSNTTGGSVEPGTELPISLSSANVFTFAQYPQLQNPGGSVRGSIQTSNGAKEVYITRVDTETAIAVSIMCTHRGCPVKAYDATTKQYVCPCHNSIFNSDGSVFKGPATEPLDAYKTTVSTQGIEVIAQ